MLSSDLFTPKGKAYLVPRFKQGQQAWRAVVVEVEPDGQVKFDTEPVTITRVDATKETNYITYTYGGPRHQDPHIGDGRELLATELEASRRILAHLLGSPVKNWFKTGQQAWVCGRGVLPAETRCIHCHPLYPDGECSYCKGTGICKAEFSYSLLQAVTIISTELVSNTGIRVTYRFSDPHSPLKITSTGAELYPKLEAAEERQELNYSRYHSTRYIAEQSRGV